MGTGRLYDLNFPTYYYTGEFGNKIYTVSADGSTVASSIGINAKNLRMTTRDKNNVWYYYFYQTEQTYAPLCELVKMVGDTISKKIFSYMYDQSPLVGSTSICSITIDKNGNLYALSNMSSSYYGTQTIKLQKFDVKTEDYTVIGNFSLIPDTSITDGKTFDYETKLIVTEKNEIYVFCRGVNGASLYKLDISNNTSSLELKFANEVNGGNIFNFCKIKYNSKRRSIFFTKSTVDSNQFVISREIMSFNISSKSLSTEIQISYDSGLYFQEFCFDKNGDIIYLYNTASICALKRKKFDSGTIETIATNTTDSVFSSHFVAKCENCAIDINKNGEIVILSWGNGTPQDSSITYFLVDSTNVLKVLKNCYRISMTASFSYLENNDITGMQWELMYNQQKHLIQSGTSIKSFNGTAFTDVGSSPATDTMFETNGFSDFSNLTKDKLSTLTSPRILTKKSDSNSTNLKFTGTPLPKLILAGSDIQLSNSIAAVDNFTLSSNISATANMRIIYSTDSGTTWKTYKNSTESLVNINSLSGIKANGMTPAEFMAIGRTTWSSILLDTNNNPSKKIRFGYYLEVANTTDAVETDVLTMQIDVNGTWGFASLNVDYEFSYTDSSTAEVSLINSGDFRISLM